MARGNYKVASGDTLSKIARDNDTTVAKLIELNPKYKENPNLIRPGQNVVLPTVNGSSSVGWANDFFSGVNQEVWQEAFIQAAEEQLGVTVDPVVEPVEDTQPVEEPVEDTQPVEGPVEEVKPVPEGEDPVIEIDDGTVDPIEEPVTTAPIDFGGFTPDELIELGAVEELLGDNQYRAFMASFGISQNQAESILTSVGERLSGQAVSGLGTWTNTTMAEGEAAPEDLLRASNRSGGLYDIQYDKEERDLRDLRSGKGMGFSGQVTKDMNESRQNRFLEEAEYERGLVDSWKEAERLKITAQEDLIKEKLKKEAEAAERISLFAAGG